MTELRPALEHFIHAMSRRLQVGADSGIGPALGVEIDNGAASLVGIGDLGVGRIAPLCHRWLGSIGEDALDGVVGWSAIKAQKTNGGNLMSAKA